MTKLARSRLLFPLALLFSWFFDFLFWKKPWGISVPLFTLLVLGLGFWLAYDRGLKSSKNSYWLLAPIIFFSFVSVIRLEPVTLFVGRALVVVFSAILALTFLGGRWLQYSFTDYVIGLLALVPRGLVLFAQSAPERNVNEHNFFRRVIFPILRGLLIGLPLLWFLATLLGASDPFFAQWLEDLLAFLSIEDLIEYLFRGFYVLVLAYMLAAAYSYATLGSKKEELRGLRKPLIRPILGFTEGVTILAAMELLFTAFVVIQFRYFFGGLGQVIDNPAGFTFAEYARRGFGELVVVAISSLLFFIGLSSITKREPKVQRSWFSSLGIALFALVSVILVSAYQRLLLYESAYGFTRMRIYPHVFMIWLGLLLLAVVLLELLNRPRSFALAVLLAAMGFAGTLTFFNVDAFIARANVARAKLVYDLDYSYLSSLSDDAVPALVKEYMQSLEAGEQQLSNELAVSLACHYANRQGFADEIPWQGWNISRQRAASLMAQIASDRAFPIAEEMLDDWGGWAVQYSGQNYECQAEFFSRD